ncbi:MAG: hypothetical protein U1C46_09280 [Bacteroidales bacterium]|nr:hypothetical protein [Bacteroidales bacterium]MDZ4204994.1 hypothetical protein [Bacteroidales bacterium]
MKEMNEKYIISLIAIAVVGLLIFTSCSKLDNFSNDPAVKLEFSADTVLFDTVFTTLGTATRVLTVYNTEKQWLKISSIRLARGESSPFRLNIDGVATLNAKDIELAPKDSLYIFIRATIDPNNQSGMMIETDSILFSVNSNLQDVKLVAWGEDAHFYTNAVVASNYVMRNDKPHVIYGYMAVDSSFTLTITQGARLYFHHNSFLLVYRDATLKVFGTQDEPVIFQGDRTEFYFRDLPGQWGHKDAGTCIYFYPGSINNEMHYTVIKNGVVGIQADTIGNSTAPTLRLYNSQIRNMLGIGLLARGTHIEAANLVIANCGSNALAILYGGNYDFRHLTIGNYWTRTARQSPSLFINNYYYYQNQQIARNLVNAYFGNCIVYGNLNEEIELDKSSLAIFNYNFDYCFVRTARNIETNPLFVNCTRNVDPKFIETQVHNLEPDTLSPVIDKGGLSVVHQSLFNIKRDIKGVSRISDAAPDPGAYEFASNRLK